MGLLSIFQSRAARDAARLVAVLPELRNYDRLAAKAYELLEPHHRKYLANVSSEDHVASIRTCAFLLTLCDIAKPKRIADLGSGFSSFVVRTYAASAPQPTEVWSVDDSSQWLLETRRFLAEMSVSADNVIVWDDFIAEDRGLFDLVFHDLGRMPKRVETFEKALSLVRPGGLFIIDDVHKKKKFGQFAGRALREARLDYYDLRYFVED